jgi:hypothetical protein
MAIVVVVVVVIEVASFGCCQGRFKEVLFVVGAMLEDLEGAAGFNGEGE